MQDKSRTNTHLAGNGDRSVHLFGQGFGDGKSEACAAIPAGNRGISLYEFPKYI